MSLAHEGDDSHKEMPPAAPTASAGANLSKIWMQVRARETALADLITAKQVKEVFSILKERDIPRDTQTWNRRYREYMEKIKTGSVFEIAEVMRDLSVLRATKDLSFGERKMLDTARGLLIKELAIAKGVTEDKLAAEVDALFAAAAA